MLIAEWENQKRQKNMDYVDADTDGDDCMLQLGEVQNYYFYQILVSGEEEDTKSFEVTAPHKGGESSHCFDCLAACNPSEFQDSLSMACDAIHQHDKSMSMAELLHRCILTNNDVYEEREGGGVKADNNHHDDDGPKRERWYGDAEELRRVIGLLNHTHGKEEELAMIERPESTTTIPASHKTPP